ncbi:MAG TPA: aminoglycoside phosphotransferase family protein [Pyrinomonadaceae bacterium]|nr:aminoglycoside phosphotransferase family protein [Pyrinomonadaceae bacterium]
MNENRFARLPDRFRQNIFDLYAEKGARWLEDLPGLIEKIALSWSLEVAEPFPNLSYNFVAPCRCADGTKAVLKIGYKEKDSIVLSEAKCLEIFDGRGAVKLLKVDENICALLLERLLPGEDLTGLCKTDDEQATAIAIGVMKKIRRAQPYANGFPDLKSWTSGLGKAEQTVFSHRHLKKAQKCFNELTGSSKQRLLHGDLHHQNILSAERESFLAIDPKGIIGDTGFEIAVFLNNPRTWILTHPNRREILEKRVAAFAEHFEIEPKELRQWAYAEAVLSAWWTLEDNGADWEKWLATAEMWEEIGI